VEKIDLAGLKRSAEDMIKEKLGIEVKIRWD
jgi:hypothetical protein